MLELDVVTESFYELLCRKQSLIACFTEHLTFTVICKNVPISSSLHPEDQTEALTKFEFGPLLEVFGVKGIRDGANLAVSFIG
jgi:hypothetical protein